MEKALFLRCNPWLSKRSSEGGTDTVDSSRRVGICVSVVIAIKHMMITDS